MVFAHLTALLVASWKAERMYWVLTMGTCFLPLPKASRNSWIDTKSSEFFSPLFMLGGSFPSLSTD